MASERDMTRCASVHRSRRRASPPAGGRFRGPTRAVHPRSPPGTPRPDELFRRADSKSPATTRDRGCSLPQTEGPSRAVLHLYLRTAAQARRAHVRPMSGPTAERTRPGTGAKPSVGWHLDKFTPPSPPRRPSAQCLLAPTRPPDDPRPDRSRALRAGHELHLCLVSPGGPRSDDRTVTFRPGLAVRADTPEVPGTFAPPLGWWTTSTSKGSSGHSAPHRPPGPPRHRLGDGADPGAQPRRPRQPGPV